MNRILAKSAESFTKLSFRANSSRSRRKQYISSADRQRKRGSLPQSYLAYVTTAAKSLPAKRSYGFTFFPRQIFYYFFKFFFRKRLRKPSV